MLDDNCVGRSSSVWPSVIVFVSCSSVVLGKEVLAAFIQSVKSQCPKHPFFFFLRVFKTWIKLLILLIGITQ